MRTLFRGNSWLVLLDQGRLSVYQKGRLVSQLQAARFNELQCSLAESHDNDKRNDVDSGRELFIYGNNGNSIVQLKLDSQNSCFSQVDILKVSFQISKFLVFPAVGWVLATDNVTGALHLFDTINERYKGRIRVDTTCCKVWKKGDYEFKVMTRLFDPETLLIKRFLNTYAIDKTANNTYLRTSVLLDHHSANRWVCNGLGNSEFFSIVSSEGFTSLVEIFLPHAKRPFHQITLPFPISKHQAWFSSPLSMLLVLQNRRGLEMCEIDLVTQQKLRTIPIHEISVASYRQVTDTAKPTQMDLFSTVAATDFEIQNLQFTSSRTVVFIVKSAPWVLFAWHGSQLYAWWFPSAILGVSNLEKAELIEVECLSSVSSSITENFHIELRDLEPTEINTSWFGMGQPPKSQTVPFH
ncbi:LADA_0B06238g1_1 [Lachancea dasiensis]|uniref:LADA_0B06238g1_1 n=1 Tax=Lachancea dasiensis TaxID=1072105 RepID=A0A1G4ITS0_9SACH|nr:LADA_0B06238g1_1 [Lachancea dasiensis]